ncbi:OmpA family protein [Campylobacter sp. MIT 21-1685]|uniref:OmpA family protein n=1 Tax=unclassified Campylobacter TaxID=2593542 RepID=UPI00224ACFC0|nr:MULTISPECIES: OmpA family protein [unclassified Campylobacter]MCX2683251.1 OmpA family protein [Campylobacter sp. MIT 21-1684]MCX2751556.1 OmpA family protein [Campylobacter sp. MIT 21-1682]MCX2807755.1 OmpA family protein [Campylobacter sp. MIT 21-1685]
MKKMLLCLGLASVLFATDDSIKFELTPTLNYNHPEGNLNMRNTFSPGLRLGYHFDNFWLDQLEFGFEYYKKMNYTDKQKTNMIRNYFTAIKGINLDEKFYFYGLAGVGYEHLSKELYENKSDGFGHYGVGLKYRFSDSLALKLETRDQISFNNANHNWVTTLGMSFGLGKKERNTFLPNHTSHQICPQTPKEGAILDENGCEKVINLEGHFDFDQSTLNPTFQENIKEIAKILDENDRYNAVLEGHTDNVGSKTYNQKLSERRATNVAKELEKYGISNERIQIKGYGAENPRSNNATKEGRADNRRVEVHFVLQ